MVTAPDSAWQRLGDLLVARRIELSPRWRNRTRFAEEVGLHWRMLFDIERAKRQSFPAETLMAIEVAYRWQYGSIERVLAGGDPLPVEDTDLTYDDVPHYGDPTLESFRNTAEAEGVKAGFALSLIEWIKEGLGTDDNGNVVTQRRAG
jgi:hypothetical protein